MLSKVLSLGLSGVNGYEVQTECYIGTGLPAFELVGLPDASVKEARERVRAAHPVRGQLFDLKHSPGGMVDGHDVVMTVKPGDKVITSKYAGTEVKLDDEEYVVVRQSDILAIVE